jgi:protein-S-isoprenylcysteine O-methyltransferase Ste14
MDISFTIRLIIFISGSVIIAIISGRSLKSIRYHGFFRFFVFELSLALVLLNFPFWFQDPLSLHQMISWILLIYSGLLIVESVYYFKKYGGPVRREQSPANFEFEDTSNLIRIGIYKYIRHPMYGSLLFLSLGAMFKFISLLTGALALITIVLVILTARAEEKEDIKFFGSGYKEYMKTTKMFIPFIF